MNNDKLMTVDELKDFSADVGIEHATRSALELSRDDWQATIAVLRRLANGHAYAKSGELHDDNILLFDQEYGSELSDRMWDLKMVMMEAFGGPGGAANEFDEVGPHTDELDIDDKTQLAIHEVDWLIRRGRYVLARLEFIAHWLADDGSVLEHPEVVRHVNEKADELNWHRVVDTFVRIAERACGGADVACQRIMHRNRSLYPDTVVDVNGVLLWSHHALLLGFIDDLEIDAEEMKEAERSLAARGILVKDPEDGELRLTAYGLEEAVSLFDIEKSAVPDLYKAMTPKPKGNVKPIR